jgi:UDP-N-acetyl-D-glucosamine dehydrogenase
VKGSRIHILGVAYKKNIDDVRESPALDIIHLLKERGGLVSYSDPYVADLAHEGQDMKSTGIAEGCGAADCVVVVTDHKDFVYAEVLEASKLIVDTRNAFKAFQSEKIVRL